MSIQGVPAWMSSQKLDKNPASVTDGVVDLPGYHEPASWSSGGHARNPGCQEGVFAK